MSLTNHNMSKKPISFGKISLNINKTKENNDNSDNTSASGFGTFGRTPIQEQKLIEEIAEDLENQHVQQVMGIKNFGKKAKNFDLQEVFEQAKKTAQEVNKQKSENESHKGKTVTNQSETKKDDENDIIGPLPPPSLSKTSELSTDNEIIGPLIPSQISDDVDSDKGEDSYDELSGSDDEELTLEKRIPNSHEVIL